jgi:signal transduction histidine kinase
MKLSLRLRFFAAIGLVAAVIIGAFSLALWEFIEVLELELLDKSLTRELHEFADRYAHEPDLAPPVGADLRGYILRAGETAALPAGVLALPQGLHEDVWIDGRETFVGRKDVNGARLYLVMEIEPVEALEAQLVGLALLCGVGAFFLSALGAVVLSRVVMRPVTRLAQTVSALAPQQRGVRLVPEVEKYGDREIGGIASAIDRYLERIDQYIEREQSFTADASHELRTPLATVLSAVQLLDEQPGLAEPVRERLTRIRRAGLQMQSLIDAMLFLAREDGGGPVQDCALDDIVRDAVEAAQAPARARGLALEARVEPLTRRVVPGMAASVVNNLLLNAIHHSGGTQIEVALGGGRLTVRDRGPGIAPAELSRIFERGYRGEQSSGLGLGLSLVRRICDRLGWTVQVSSAASEGTLFTILLDKAAPTKN